MRLSQAGDSCVLVGYLANYTLYSLQHSIRKMYVYFLSNWKRQSLKETAKPTHPFIDYLYILVFYFYSSFGIFY